ncbi:MAG: hypothetical protein IQL11_17615 [Bacteroidales bacterium]|nr:hypothetical protein [Bacteroidales bacterium]
MRKCLIIFIYLFIIFNPVSGQVKDNSGTRVLFHGLVLDAETLTPLSGSRISVNRSLFSFSDNKGEFAFYVSRNDTMVFSRLGYKQVVLLVSDTLSGKEYITGIYMHSDTLLIGEVVIVPRLSSLRSEILNARPEPNPEMENARYNLEISAYQGRITQNKLGDPAANYEMLRQQQKVSAYEKGGIPSDRIVGFSPFLLIPAAYLLMHGLPEKPPPLKPMLTDKEVSQIHEKYLKTLKQKIE